MLDLYTYVISMVNKNVINIVSHILPGQKTCDKICDNVIY